MGLRTLDIAALVLNLIHCIYSNHILSCSVTSLESSCPSNQICNQTTLQCDCLPGYTMVAGDCEIFSTSQQSHAITAVLVTIFAVALVVCGLVLVIRKYNLIEYARQRINMRRNNDVMYEDVMIGQDDPPLSP